MRVDSKFEVWICKKWGSPKENVVRKESTVRAQGVTEEVTDIFGTESATAPDKEAQGRKGGGELSQRVAEGSREPGPLQLAWL